MKSDQFMELSLKLNQLELESTRERHGYHLWKIKQFQIVGNNASERTQLIKDMFVQLDKLIGVIDYELEEMREQ